MKKIAALIIFLLIVIHAYAYPGHARILNSPGKFPLFKTDQGLHKDSLDVLIESLLKKRQVPGLSLAIIQDGKIVKTKAYGYIDKAHTIPVTESTLFQAGSISKSVSALGALLLVERNQLSLDEDVNVRLKTWKVPDNEFTKNKKVSLRSLLSHTSGLTIQGFSGYPIDDPVPSLVQILEGSSPANNMPVRVDFVPGTSWRYSGGGYTVMQQLVVDLAEKSFPEYMQEAVLEPLKMKQSTFEQPLSAKKAEITATAHNAFRDPVKGRWHIYPEMAAAGLWTTPSDLARFAIGIQHALTEKSGSVLSRSMAMQMLTEEKNNDGLGVFVEGSGAARRFGHSGRNEGFDAYLSAGAQDGQGVVIMINANDNSRMKGQIVNAVAELYHWNGYPVTKPVKRIVAKVDAARFPFFEGRYELENNQMITFISENSRLYALSDGLPDEEFVPIAADEFASLDRDITLSFTPDAKKQVTNLVWKDSWQSRIIPRIGPLFPSTENSEDSDPARSKRIQTVLNAMQVGGKTLEDTPGIAAGTIRPFLAGTQSLEGMTSIEFLHSEDVAGRKIIRHESEIYQIICYRSTISQTPRYVLVYLDQKGLVADCDVVLK